MIYLQSDSTNPYFNLALEEYIFESMDPKQTYLLLWQNEATIVVGKNQNTAEEINQEAVARRGIRVVRRLSGGGAVYHDRGNLNYTFVVDQAEAEAFQFRAFAAPVVEALARLGVQAECNGRNDLTIDGRKFSGNSQYLRHGRLLHHGCIMLDSNLADVAEVLRVRPAKFESKSVKSVRSRVTSINAHAPSPISMAQFRNVLLDCIAARTPLTPGSLRPADLAAIEQLQKDKYERWDWNFGVSPPFRMQRELRFDGGLLCVHLDVREGCIAGIRLYGDFFGNGELSQLEAALTGLPLDEQLEQKLEVLDIGTYIHGLQAKALADLLR